MPGHSGTGVDRQLRILGGGGDETVCLEVIEVLVGDENGCGNVQDVLLRRHRARVNHEALGIFFQSNACVAKLRKFHFTYGPSYCKTSWILGLDPPFFPGRGKKGAGFSPHVKGVDNVNISRRYIRTRR